MVYTTPYAVKAAAAASGTYPTVAPVEFERKMARDRRATLIDVRPPEYYADGHIAGAKNINWMNAKEFERAASSMPKDRKYYVYCQTGMHSRLASNYLAARGFKVVNLDGGITAWREAGLPVEK